MREQVAWIETETAFCSCTMPQVHEQTVQGAHLILIEPEGHGSSQDIAGDQVRQGEEKENAQEGSKECQQRSAQEVLQHCEGGSGGLNTMLRQHISVIATATCSLSAQGSSTSEKAHSGSCWS